MNKIMIEVPAHYKALAQAVEGFVQCVERFEQAGPRLRQVDYRQHEQALAAEAAAIERAGHAASLAALDVDARRLRIDGELHRRVGRYPARYKTRTGEVEVTRSLYRPEGGRNGATVNVVSLRTGAVLDEWLPQTATMMAHRLARGTSREAAEASEVEGVLPYCRSSFERVGHAVGAAMAQKRVEIEEALVAEMPIAEQTASVSVALDRISVPMEEPRRRPVGRPPKDAPKRPVTVAHRMGWAGTVTLHDDSGEALATVRYGQMPGDDGEQLAETLASDALALLRRRSDLKLVTLGDGAADVQGLLERHIDDETFGPVVRLVDLWHVLEKLSAALAVMEPNDDRRKERLADWRRRLCTKEGAVWAILGELRRSNQRHVRVDESKPVHEAITYLENQGHLMRYACARKRGLPLGSGHVEATCKSLFTMRLKRPGARWKAPSGARVVTMRAHMLSNRWQRAAELALPSSHVQVRAA